MCVSLCVHMNNAYAQSHLCEEMHVCLYVCVYEQGVCLRSFVQGGACMCLCAYE
jgi:hypothetical protein